ncbi:MAG: phosphatidylserine/phosphatidylglycerophosphate/cardiolipin synthase family protein [Halofilum sp. (in: g-proteobacteria)]|nr:phosphatidylserine/phosphatidylglycerophosphate/cardiolipin synthase family protein [Halofilum sp. (in: g-proteobacteria)]
MRKPEKPQRFPRREANEFEVLCQGTHYFPAMISAIDQAEERIALEMYWVASGPLAERFIRALASAADRGVRVFVLLDDYGCSDLDAMDRRRLAQAGIRVALFNPLQLRVGWGNFIRDHRKLLLVDDELAFVGGAGLAEPFDGDRGWRENMLRIRGECVADWWRLFARVWNRWSAVDCPSPSVVQAGSNTGRILPGSPIWRPVLAAAIRDIRRARRRVWLATPYFLPPVKLRRALARARRRGCDVRLIVPDEAHCDVPAVHVAGRRYYDRLLRRGIRVFEYHERVTHQKVLLADERVTIGSCNYDRWGLRWNLEASQGIESTEHASAVGRMLEDDLAHCREITAADRERRTLRQRIAEWFWGVVDAAMVSINHARLIRRERASRTHQ